MDQLIPHLYKVYGEQVNSSRAFPYEMDGMKPVERRVMMVAYLVAKDKLVKSARVDGTTIAKFHPHGSCIVGDTRIPLLDGTKPTIKELSTRKDLFWLYSCKPNGRIVFGLAHSARITKIVNALCEITLDNDKKIFCTDDHMFMLRSGNYQHAGDLSENVSLMSFRLKTENAKNNNPRVKTVKFIKLETPIEVYDLSVEKYHNFAISSGVFIHNCYGTIVQMVKQEFLQGQGNFGVNLGVEPMPPAAMRYTEVRLTKTFHDMAFKLIKHTNWIEGELGDDEPEYLPTKYPVCLLGKDYTQGIGFGFRTVIPCYELDDLKKRLMWLLGKEKIEPIIKPISDCKILSKSDVLKEILTTGRGVLKLEGIVKVDNARCKTTLKSWPPGKRFEGLLSKFKKELDSNDIGFTDASCDKTGTEIIFEVIKQRNRDKIFKEFTKKLKETVTGNITFEVRVSGEDGKIKLLSVDQMLLNIYKIYTQVNKRMLGYTIQKFDDEIQENMLIQKIAPLLSKYFESSKEVNVDEVILLISQTIGEKDIKIKEIFSKYTIRKLLTFKSDIQALIIKKSEAEGNLNNIDQFVLDQYS